MSDLSLRDLFEQLIRDPELRSELEADQAGFLDARGFGDLDDSLTAEALSHAVSGFPPEVAEHFTDYTVAASPVPSDSDGDDIDLGDALGLVASAPAWPDAESAVTDVGESSSDAPAEAVDADPDVAADADGAGAADGFGTGADTPPEAASEGASAESSTPAAEAAAVAEDDFTIDPLDELGSETPADAELVEDVESLDLDEPSDLDGDVLDG